MKVNKLPYKIIDGCRICSSTDLHLIHNFGAVPVADKLCKNEKELAPTAQLSICFCDNCKHLQIKEDIDPTDLFKFDYPYYSSKIPEVEEHFAKSYETIISQISITEDDCVLEIASNDGSLIKHFKNNTNCLIAIEPSIDHIHLTEALDIKTYSQFFTTEFSNVLRNELKQLPKLILANNVLAHVPDTFGFAKGLKNLLAKDGTIVIEVPHSGKMIKNCTFDVIFHQHFSYFNLHSLNFLFKSADLNINKVDRIKTQGGGVRLYINHFKEVHHSVTDLLKEEIEDKLVSLTTYSEFSKSIDRAKNELSHLLQQLKKEGKSIVGYGAPGKASTMLNYFGINKNYLDYIVDISDSKHNFYFPNTGLKIYPVEKLNIEKPDFILILAWNYADSIMANLSYLEKEGVKFILPYPIATIV